ncbi:MAG: hypothetical protein K2Y37_16180 [Pirellulales bacterium]|nr:hypothetical protein [Pirellulales bacterium]
MNQPTCCQKSWISELDLGSAGGFEFTLGKCDQCESYWMHVYCTASNTSAFKSVSLADVERMKLIPPPERKAFMKSWGEEQGLI